MRKGYKPVKNPKEATITIDEVIKRVKSIDLEPITLARNPIMNKINKFEFRRLVAEAFEGYTFEGEEEVEVKEDLYNIWDYTARIKRYGAPLLRIYVKREYIEVKVG